jgi:hypothetical protein
MAASARFSWPLARSYLAVSVQDLMTADTRGLRYDRAVVRLGLLPHENRRS